MKKLISGAVLLLAMPVLAGVPYELNESTNSDQFKINHKIHINTNFDYLNSKSDDIALTITDNKNDIKDHDSRLDSTDSSISANAANAADAQSRVLVLEAANLDDRLVVAETQAEQNESASVLNSQNIGGIAARVQALEDNYTTLNAQVATNTAAIAAGGGGGSDPQTAINTAAIAQNANDILDLQTGALVNVGSNSTGGGSISFDESCNVLRSAGITFNELEATFTDTGGTYLSFLLPGGAPLESPPAHSADGHYNTDYIYLKPHYNLGLQVYDITIFDSFNVQPPSGTTGFNQENSYEYCQEWTLNSGMRVRIGFFEFGVDELKIENNDSVIAATQAQKISLILYFVTPEDNHYRASGPHIAENYTLDTSCATGSDYSCLSDQLIFHPTQSFINSSFLKIDSWFDYFNITLSN